MKFFRNRFVKFILYLLNFTAVWNLVTYLITTFIAKGTYFFEPLTCLALPLIIAIVLGYRFISVKETNQSKPEKGGR